MGAAMQIAAPNEEMPMEIQLIHRLVHSDGNVHTVYEPGDIYECSAADAKILIEQGSAVALEEIKTEKPKPKKVS